MRADFQSLTPAVCAVTRTRNFAPASAAAQGAWPHELERGAVLLRPAEARGLRGRDGASLPQPAESSPLRLRPHPAFHTPFSVACEPRSRPSRRSKVSTAAHLWRRSLARPPRSPSSGSATQPLRARFKRSRSSPAGVSAAPSVGGEVPGLRCAASASLCSHAPARLSPSLSPLAGMCLATLQRNNSLPSLTARRHAAPQPRRATWPSWSTSC